MAGFTDTLIESIKQSLDWSLWLYFLAVQLIEGLLAGFIVLLFLFVGAILMLNSFTPAFFQNPMAFFLNPANLVGIIGTVCLLSTILIVVLVFVASYFTGLRFNLFNGFMKTKKIDLGKAFEATTPRAFTYFKVSVVIALVVSVALLVLAIPALSSIPALIRTLAPAPLIGLAIYALVALTLFSIALVIVSPILQLLAPTAFFEKKGAIGTIKRAIELAKANYLGNLAFVLAFIVIVVGISLILSLILQFVSVFTLIPAIVLSESGETAAGAVIGGLAVYGIVFVILFLPYLIWSTLFEIIVFRNLYYLDHSLIEPRARPKHSSAPKRRKRKKAK